MKYVYETPYGDIETIISREFCRLKGGRKLSPLVHQVSVRTWKKYGLKDKANNPVPADNVRCILSMDKALDEVLAKEPARILILSIDRRTFLFSKYLSKKWIRNNYCAITKTDSLPEEAFLNFLEETFTNAV